MVPTPAHSTHPIHTIHPMSLHKLLKVTPARKLAKSLIFALNSLRALIILSVETFRVPGLAGLAVL